ncbi:hypothetical protein [Pelagibius sp.]|uniref:hypothetical protein n=1 Tax=Pelagibius sp. TaxID=1931238 RepID=UPI0026392B85|nr:hypothetical protein [Pelagibius sp.]
MARILGTVLKTVCVLAILGACASPVEPPLMRASASAEAETLKLRVDDIPPGRQILALVLVDPQGGETPARDREVVTRQTGSGGAAGPGIGVGATGGSSSGIRPYISLGYLFRGSREERRSQYLTAEIPVAEPERYRSGYRDWRIEVRYRDPEGRDGLLTLAAPPL